MNEVRKTCPHCNEKLVVKSAIFAPAYVSTFMGGTFTLPRCATVSDLHVALSEWQKELDGWGEAEIAECVLTERGLEVTLAEGITQ